MFCPFFVSTNILEALDPLRLDFSNGLFAINFQLDFLHAPYIWLFLNVEDLVFGDLAVNIFTFLLCDLLYLIRFPCITSFLLFARQHSMSSIKAMAYYILGSTTASLRGIPSLYSSIVNTPH
jgi:hypothetical protein